VRVFAEQLDLDAHERAVVKFLAEVDDEYRSLLPLSEQLEGVR
jgi:hypothetical protein